MASEAVLMLDFQPKGGIGVTLRADKTWNKDSDPKSLITYANGNWERTDDGTDLKGPTAGASIRLYRFRMENAIKDDSDFATISDEDIDGNWKVTVTVA